MGKKVHLAVSDAQQRINKLEQQLKKQLKTQSIQTNKTKTKRKRLYAQLAQLRKAIQDPQNLLVDPIEEANKIKEDKQKRIQKKIEKKKQQVLSRKKQKRHQKRCLKCGSREHLLSQCTNTAVIKSQKKQIKADIQNTNNAGGFCYKCGSKQHSHKECEQQQYKFALCFYCSQKGHIARECPKNEKGLYRKGGSCFGCGSVRHTLKDCPARHGKRQAKFNNNQQF